MREDGALRAAWRTPRGRAGLVFLTFLGLLALLGPLALPDPFRQFGIVELQSARPSAEHPFGTDQLSRDVLSRVVSGARVSLSVAAIAQSGRCTRQPTPRRRPCCGPFPRRT